MLLVCGGSSIKNNGLGKFQCPNMGINNFWSVDAILITFTQINYFYNNVTRLQQGRKHFKSIVFQPCINEGCYN